MNKAVPSLSPYTNDMILDIRYLLKSHERIFIAQFDELSRLRPLSVQYERLWSIHRQDEVTAWLEQGQAGNADD